METALPEALAKVGMRMFVWVVLLGGDFSMYFGDESISKKNYDRQNIYITMFLR